MRTVQLTPEQVRKLESAHGKVCGLSYVSSGVAAISGTNEHVTYVESYELNDISTAARTELRETRIRVSADNTTELLVQYKQYMTEDGIEMDMYIPRMPRKLDSRKVLNNKDWDNWMIELLNNGAI